MLFADRPPDALADHLGYLLNWIGTASRRAFTAALAPLGLQPRHYGLLAVIAGSPPGPTQQELAQRAQIDPSSLVALLDELEAAGLAERRPHVDDRRKRAIHLTPLGQRMLTRARTLARGVGDDLTAALDAGERTELERLLHKLIGDGSAAPSS